MASILKVDKLQLSDGSTPTAGDLGIGLTSADMPAGSVIQVVSATKTDTQVIDSSSYIDISGLSVSITPKFATSKLYIHFNMSGSCANSGGSFIQLRKNGAALIVGTDSNSNPKVTTELDGGSLPGDGYISVGMGYVDSPNTTTAVTYSVAGHRGPDASGRFMVNRSNNYPASTTWDTNGVSTITVYEIKQ